MKRINQLSDVVAWRLCLGCGACAYICPGHVQLLDVPMEGIRPIVTGEASCATCQECLRVCPAVQSDYSTTAQKPPEFDTPPYFTEEWGPIFGIWEGHAIDSEIRWKGSSGGALTALAAYCLERLGMHGVLHIAEDPEDPIRNRTRLSRSRSDLLAATGSRYSPASVCNGFGLVESAPAPCVLIGKPVEIAAAQNAARMRPKFARNVGVTLSFFCAETPSTTGTENLLKRMGVTQMEVGELRYRGKGWPGSFAPTIHGESEPRAHMTYEESWAFLQAYRPWQAHLWPDGTGELADISCGDPWHEKPDGRNPGSSLVVARTPKGREIVLGAIEAGYLELSPADPRTLAQSQPALLEKKGLVWGRRLALRLLGLPLTRFIGLPLRHCWTILPMKEKVKSVLGTLRRIVQRRLYRPLQLDLTTGKPVGTPWVPSAGGDRITRT